TIELSWDAAADDVGITQYDVMAGDMWMGASATPDLRMAGLSAGTAYQFQIYASDAAGNQSEGSEPLTVTTNLPPAPADIATPTDPTVAGDLATDAAFLYSGADPIQIGVAPGALVPEQTTILRGRTIERDGLPLGGVQISVLNHPEYGHTASRADGGFDLVINGGGSITLDYAKAGLLPSQRQVDAPWHDYAVLPDVALIPLDTSVSAVVL